MLMKLIFGLGLLVLTFGASLGALYWLGSRLPREHRAEVTVDIAAPLEAVAARIRNVEAQPIWRKSLREVRLVASDAGHADRLGYVEIGDHGTIAFERTEPELDRHFVSHIADAKLPFGGRWDIHLDVAGGGSATRVRLIESGFVESPIFRFFAYYVFGHERSLRSYAADLTASYAPKAN